jgi:starch synthase
MPDVINCHDHHTGLIPFMMLYCGKYRKLQNTPSMITIHNGLYQGNSDLINYITGLIYVILEWDHCINSLAVGKVRMGSDYRFSKLFE